MRHAVRKPAAATILAVRESRPSGRLSCVWAARGVKHLQAGDRNAGDQRSRSPTFATQPKGSFAFVRQASKKPLRSTRKGFQHPV